MRETRLAAVAAEVDRRVDDGVHRSVGAALRDDVFSVQRADVVVAQRNVADLRGEIVGGEVEGNRALVQNRNAVVDDGAADGEVENLSPSLLPVDACFGFGWFVEPSG